MDTFSAIPKVQPRPCPLPLPNARDIAEGLGLDWWAALKLHDDGFLGFDPRTARITDEGMEAEFVFLGSLVAAGCDPVMLARLLAGLTKPYQYGIRSIYYDWPRREWQLLPAAPTDAPMETDRTETFQPSLFHPDAREVAERLGLDWQAAVRLYFDGWLSANPETTAISDDGMEMELSFVGTLAAAGCDSLLLNRLLASLERPYWYRIGSAYYDWGRRRWMRLPYVPSPSESFEDALSKLEGEGDVGNLRDALESVKTALEKHGESTREESFESWLDELVEDQDVATLSGIVDAVGVALDRAEEAIGKGQEAQE